MFIVAFLRLGGLLSFVLSLISLAFLSVAPALAQDTKSAQEGDVKIPLTKWTKVCPSKDPKKDGEPQGLSSCLVVQELRDPRNGGLISSVAVHLTEKENKFLVITVPPGALLEAGITLRVDEKEEAKSKFLVCYPTACVSRLELKKEMIDKFKKGNSMDLVMIGSDEKVTGFRMPLAGFTKAFTNKKGQSVESYQEMQRNFIEEIRKEAAEKIKKNKEGTKK
ncbi:MAG: invasion associated locus B family protein [Alphaproteobacteria bacterium]|nr:invasion associated locus B family protein [Alphaproteobacteria bacterium]